MLSRLNKIRLVVGVVSTISLLNSVPSVWGASDEGRLSGEGSVREKIDMSWTKMAEARSSGHSYGPVMPEASVPSTDADVSLYVQMHEAATGCANRFLLMPWSDLHTIAN